MRMRSLFFRPSSSWRASPFRWLQVRSPNSPRSAPVLLRDIAFVLALHRVRLPPAKFLAPNAKAEPSSGPFRCLTSTARRGLLWKGFVRACKLFLIGVLLGKGFPANYDLSTIRIPGVLQRIAFCYLVTLFIEGGRAAA